jgi:DNA anti-recombination protein RmuC
MGDEFQHMIELSRQINALGERLGDMQAELRASVARYDEITTNMKKDLDGLGQIVRSLEKTDIISKHEKMMSNALYTTIGGAVVFLYENFDTIISLFKGIKL